MVRKFLKIPIMAAANVALLLAETGNFAQLPPPAHAPIQSVPAPTAPPRLMDFLATEISVRAVGTATPAAAERFARSVSYKVRDGVIVKSLLAPTPTAPKHLMVSPTKTGTSLVITAPVSKVTAESVAQERRAMQLLKHAACPRVPTPMVPKYLVASKMVATTINARVGREQS